MAELDNDNKIKKAGRWLAFLPSAVAATSLFALMVMTFFDVILRSAFNDPVESATEMTRLFMAITVFSALPVISWRGDLIVVDLFDPLFSARLARIRDVIINIVCGIVLFWPALRVWQLAGRAREYGDVTEYLNIPQFYIAYFIAIATFVTAVVLLVRGICFIFVPQWVVRSTLPGESPEDEGFA
ncbi:MAG: TRAP transporter small permease subunit [Hyphomicrobiales bacterium]|nr:TRAP transporter small permease subunit [Hyphomicrobiales bacterium]